LLREKLRNTKRTLKKSKNTPTNRTTRLQTADEMLGMDQRHAAANRMSTLPPETQRAWSVSNNNQAVLGPQVPQFILDDAINRGMGSTCRVVCTQPRRISAISVWLAGTTVTAINLLLLNFLTGLSIRVIVCAGFRSEPSFIELLTRGGWSHIFRLRLRSSKNFESGSDSGSDSDSGVFFIL